MNNRRTGEKNRDCETNVNAFIFRIHTYVLESRDTLDHRYNRLCLDWPNLVPNECWWLQGPYCDHERLGELYPGNMQKKARRGGGRLQCLSKLISFFVFCHVLMKYITNLYYRKCKTDCSQGRDGGEPNKTRPDCIREGRMIVNVVAIRRYKSNTKSKTWK